ncbi:class I SAM-dependent methyltransferase [Chitinophaga sp. 30R24]|uniref:class I SAM-dependent methyltransferase n=1 Tax=Chitinophaga sp. 30R24 TaxID=3248838 RepID=UPI003B9817AD
MELQEAISMISGKDLAPLPAGKWADLGCGSGLFTFALAHLLPAGSTIYALDKSNIILQEQPNPHQVTILPRQIDFVKADIRLSELNGILMANSLHYVADKPTLIHTLQHSMKKDSAFLIVEYDTAIPNPWVPYPVKFEALKRLFTTLGYSKIVKLGERTSLYRSGQLYAAWIER